MKKIITIILASIIIAPVMIFLIDPAFGKVVSFQGYSVEYDWRIFNNDFCNYRTHDHCADNEFNKYNAEIDLLKKLAESYEGQKIIENRLIKAVNQRPMAYRIYTDLTKSSELQVDSIIKYRNKIFQKMWIE